MKLFGVCCGAGILMMSSGDARASNKLTLYYNDRPPFLELQSNGSVQGLTASAANQALELAGISYVWKKASAEQQLEVINRNQEAACLVGWFKRPERLLLGKFSSPIYAGKSMVALNLARHPQFKDKMRLVDLVRDSDLIMLAKFGYSYGHIIDEQVKNYAPKQVFATGENTNMLQMLLHGRSDYLLVSEEEARVLIERSGRPSTEFRLTYFVEGIKEDTRHFWCTRQVSDNLLKKLNTVLQRNVVEGTPRQAPRNKTVQ